MSYLVTPAQLVPGPETEVGSLIARKIEVSTAKRRSPGSLPGVKVVERIVALGGNSCELSTDYYLRGGVVADNDRSGVAGYASVDPLNPIE
ncbi:hypothetical protein DIJ64_13965 [Mycobacterium leprae]|uniref:Uncharacterized protein n=1 Tax=Mycobacterium leprae TaxID=1769 RepID=A0AAD2JE20_MYCLR|nr:hypothetical protein [Mycobacterium leprae]AWV48767.1 hypothetical protein DIJ64_13965 [Mycobacterium leprae]OAR20465.1 hypothetical protein A8144_02250 [Mycobacterium leprae 3125609]OAX72074.1 hypothetical protein A3216_02545 [Mycobacterium leprae 7935681]